VADAPFTRAGRRESQKRWRRIGLAAVVIAAGATAAGVWAATSDHDDHAVSPQPARRRPTARSTRPDRLLRVGSRAAGSLPAPIQDAAIATVRRRVLLLGGLDAADTSTADVRTITLGRVRTIGRLPNVFHDGAAVQIGSKVYEFGGGDGIRQLDQILRVDPTTGTASRVGSLPAPSSDHAAVVVAGQAYIVGGYTGRNWLNTIVAWRPGESARVVGHLPTGLRYAAVTAAQGKIVVAGGSLADGNASRAVYSFDPRGRALRRLGSLPAATTHAGAAALDNHALVIGGRSARADTPTSRIVAIDPTSGRIRVAGHLPRPLSDAAATTLGRTVLVAGGRGQTTDAELTSLSAIGPSAPKEKVRPTQRASQSVVDVYAHDGANDLSPTVRGVPARVYVPNSASNTVDVIDQRTFKIVAHYTVGLLPQHVTPSYDLRTLWVDNDGGNSLTPVSPITGRPKGKPVPVSDPYNLYFTPGGRFAIVVAEREHRLDFRFAHSMKLHRALVVPCSGIDHLDFSANGRFLLASCEFSARMVKVDVRRERVVGVIRLPRAGAMPQDVKLSPDGKIFYVADMASNGVWEIDRTGRHVLGFIHTGAGAHGLYPSRNAKLLYITNRNEGTISVLNFATRRLVAKWDVGGSPDMGGVSADGKVLWLSARYNAQVYAISTKNGRVLARISVGYGPHGVCVWPQPGRYSLGHTGMLR
jgi:DNA-binding beta-propeller fold protein YncE